LNDPEIEPKIREREPRTSDDAVKLAQRFEIFKSTVEGFLTNRNKVSRKVGKEENVQVADMESRIAQLERSICTSHNKQNKNSSIPFPDNDTQLPKTDTSKRSRDNRRFKQSCTVTKKTTRSGRMI